MGASAKPGIRLTTLGGLFVESDGVRVDRLASQRKSLALLAMLAVAGKGGLSRDKVLALLWPESSSDQARNALSQLLFRTKRDVGADAVIGTTDLRINHEVISSDVEELIVALTAGNDARAVTLYAGSFLDGFFLSDAPEFEQWIQEQRSNLHRRVLSALERLAQVSESSGNHASVLQWRQRAMMLEPLSARAASAYVAALVSAGDRETALRFGNEYTDRVRRELEADPDPAFAELLDRVRQLDTPSAALPPLHGGPNGNHIAINGSSVRSEMSRDHRGRRRAVGGLAAIAIAATAFFVVSRQVSYARERRIDLTDPSGTRPVVLVAPIENLTGDTTLNSMSRTAASQISTHLLRTGVVGVLEAENVMRPALTGRSAAETSAMMTNLVRATRSRAVIVGSFTKQGDSLEFQSKVMAADRVRVLSALDPVRMPAADPAAGLAEVGSRLTGALASLIDDRIATLRDPSVPPPRFEAYQEYVRGLDYFTGRFTPRFDYPSAIVHFERAARLDTMFNLPLIWLGMAHGNNQNLNARDSVVNELERRADRLTPLDRSALDYFLAGRARKPEDAYRAAVTAAELAPLSNWTYIRGMMAHRFGRIHESLSAYSQLNADETWIKTWVFYWSNFAAVLHDAGRFGEEMTVLRDGIRHSSDPWIYLALFRGLGARGDTKSIDRLTDSLELHTPAGAPLRIRAGERLRMAAFEASVHGHQEEAKHLAQRCVEKLRQHEHEPDIVFGKPFPPSRNQSMLAECYSFLHDWPNASQAATVAATFSDGYGDIAATRLVLDALHQGDTATMQRRLAEAYARPAFTVNSPRRHLLDASIAAMRNDAKTTAAELSQIVPAFGGFGRDIWHEWPEITPRIRASRDMRPLVRPGN